MSERARGGGGGGGGGQAPISSVLPYVPAELLAGADALSQLERLREGAKVTISTVEGAALFVDVTGFSSLARSLTRSDAASAAEQLTSTLNEYFLQLVSRLHARGAEILLFAGDAVVAFISATAERPLREAAGLAVEAALDVQAISFMRRRHRLTAHTGVGAGELHLYVLRGSARAAQALYAGDLIVQVCEAQRASKEGDVVLSASLHALLGGSHRAEPLDSGPFFRLLQRPDLHAPRPLAVNGRLAGDLCACGARRRAGERGAAAALEPYADQILRLLPAAAAAREENTLWGSDIRTVFTVFASFPELDSEEKTERRHAGHSSRIFDGPIGHPAARHAARFGQVVRSVHRVAEEFGGSVNKIVLDDKGASTIIGFGLPGGFAHEDDAERAVRAALALQSWFEASGSPFACGIAAGRTFCGTLGAPCSKEYALIGDSVILAARLMGTARETIVPPEGGGTPRATRQQEILVDGTVVSAVAAQGRPTGFTFEASPPVHAKGFPEPVPVWRPVPRDGVAPLLLSRPSSQQDARPVRRASAPGAGGRLGVAGHKHPASLCGREEELEKALAAVEAFAIFGRGSTLVLEGDAGMGKTRLLRDVQRACTDRGVLILATAAGAVDESTPLWALRGLVASIANVSSGEALRADLEARRLLPAADAALLWAHLFGGAERKGGDRHLDSPRSITSAHSYRRLGAASVADFGVALVTQISDALSRLLHSLEAEAAAPNATAAARRPVAVFVEDCHWMDTASWFVLRCLRDTCPHVLLVLTARPMADAPRDYLILCGRADDSRGTSPTRESRSHGGGRVLPQWPLAEDDDPAAGQSDVAVSSIKSFHLPSPSAIDRISNRSRPDVYSAPVETRMNGEEGAKPSSPHPGGFANLSFRAAPALAPLMLDLASGSAAATRSASPLLPANRLSRAGRKQQLPPLRGTTSVVRLSLGPLSPPAARALLAALSEQMELQWPPDALDLVLEKAAGVPLFLVELCRQRAAIAGGSAEVKAAQSLSFSVPETIQQIVLARVDRVPGYAQAILKLLAVIGSRFTPELVAAIDPSSIGRAVVHRAFRQLRKAGLIGASLEAGSDPTGSEPDDDESGGVGGEGEKGEPGWPPPDMPFSFLHALVQEAVYGSMPEAHRCDVHRRLATRLEARADVDSSILAAHWKGAGEPERALTHLERAARAAYRTNALLEARRVLAELVSTIDDLELAGPPSRPLPASLRPRTTASGPRLNRRDSSLPAGAISSEERARWHVTRTSALRLWMFAEYFSGNHDAAAEAAEVLIDSVQPGWVIRKRLGLLATAGAMARVLRAAQRVGKPPRPGTLWLQRPENAELRDALIDALNVCAWTGLPKSAFGGRGGDGWVLTSLLRSFELSDGSPSEMHGVPDIRAWSNFATLIDVLGFSGRAAILMDRGLHLAEVLDSDAGRASVHNHKAMQSARAGRLAETAAECRLASGVRNPQPNNHELLMTLAISLFFTGAFNDTRRVLNEAQVFASRLGADRFGVFLADSLGALLALVTGRDAHAAAHVARAEEAQRSHGLIRWWFVEAARSSRLILHWRRGDLSTAFDLAERVLATWRNEYKTLAWIAAPLVMILLDFAMWARAEARAALAEAGGGRGRCGWLCCGRPSIGTSHSFRTRSAAAVHAQPSEAASAQDTAARVAVWPVEGGREADAARRAERFVAEVVRLAEHGGRHRVPMLAPFCTLARAEHESGSKRLSTLREAAAGFARSSMRPFEALAQLRLSRAERDPAAAAVAAEAAARIAGEIGLVIPAMGRPPGPPGEFVSMFV